MRSADLPQNRTYRSVYGSSLVYALADLQYDQKLMNPAFSSLLLERAVSIAGVFDTYQYALLQFAVI